MKAILIVDKPNCCEQCEFCKPEMSFWWEVKGGKCSRTNKDVTEAIFEETIDKNCPLKPLPNKIELGYPCEKYEEGYCDGWDECIDEILGGSDDNISI